MGLWRGVLETWAGMEECVDARGPALARRSPLQLIKAEDMDRQPRRQVVQSTHGAPRLGCLGLLSGTQNFPESDDDGPAAAGHLDQRTASSDGTSHLPFGHGALHGRADDFD